MDKIDFGVVSKEETTRPVQHEAVWGQMRQQERYCKAITASTSVPKIKLRSPTIIQDDLSKFKLSKSNYMCAQIKCLLARDYSYTIESLLYNEIVQQLIYKGDSGIDEKLLSKNHFTKCNNVDFASCKRDNAMK